MTARTQRCSICEVPHKVSAFDVNARTGKRNKCCRMSIARSRRHALEGGRLKKWRQNNRVQVNATALAWAKRNRKRKREIYNKSYLKRRASILAKKTWLKNTDYMRAWRKAHPGYYAANTKAWRKKYPDRARATDAQMSAKRRAAPGVVTAAEWARIVLFYGHKCGECQKKRPLTVDHYIPLAKGGTHTFSNVWPLCWPCNQLKHTQVPAGAPPHVTVLRQTIKLRKEA